MEQLETDDVVIIVVDNELENADYNFEEGGSKVQTNDRKAQLSEFTGKMEIKQDDTDPLEADQSYFAFVKEELQESNPDDYPFTVKTEYDFYEKFLKQEETDNELSSCAENIENPLSSDEGEIEYLEGANQQESLLVPIGKLPKGHKHNKNLSTVIKSYINDFKQEFSELMEDEELLVEVLSNIMKEVKAPPLPESYYLFKNGKYMCIFCGRVTSTLPAASRHYLEKHGERYLVCYACGESYRSRTILYKHEKICKAPDIDIVLKARGIFLGRKAKNRPFLDHTKTFRPKDSFRIKKNSLGSDVEGDTFQCHECPAVFRFKQRFLSHLNKHSGNRPYKCTKCSNAYTCPMVLKRHYETHDTVGYICDVCSRKFKMKSTLSAHLNTHLPYKRFACPECPKRYSHKYALTIHVDKIHKQLPEPYACQICPKKFYRTSNLKEHMQKHHGLSIMTRNMFEKRLPKLSEEEVQKAKIVMTCYVTDDVPIPINE